MYRYNRGNFCIIKGESITDKSPIFFRFEVLMQAESEKGWWKDFQLTKSDVERLKEHIREQNDVVSWEELQSLACRYKCESFYNLRPYYPAYSYQIGEKIVFVDKQENVCRAEVLEVERGQYIRDFRAPADFIRVRFLDGGWRQIWPNRREPPDQFVCNSPTYMKEKLSALYEKFEPSDEMKRDIAGALQEVLSESEDIVLLKEGLLSVRSLPRIGLSQRDEIYEMLLHSKEGFTTNRILASIFQVSPSEPEYELWEVALERILKRDSRFLLATDTPEKLWKLAPPPKQALNTLKSEMINTGAIRITRGLLRMLDYYGLGEQVELRVYGDYRLMASVDRTAGYIWSDDIRKWFEENGLEEGDKIWVVCPEADDKLLRLYHTVEAVRRKGQKRSDIVFRGLRSQVYELLESRGKWLHVKRIQQGIRELYGAHPRKKSIEATLSKNDHLFVRMRRQRGIWGLRAWGNEVDEERVDLQSLLLAIGDDDLVYRVLEAHGEPLSERKIVEEIGSLFGVSPRTLLMTTLIDRKDPRLVLLTDKWALKEWTDRWQSELTGLGKKLQHLETLKCKIDAVRWERDSLQQELLHVQAEARTVQNQIEADKACFAQLLAELRDWRENLERREREEQKQAGRIFREAISGIGLAAFGVVLFATVIFGLVPPMLLVGDGAVIAGSLLVWWHYTLLKARLKRMRRETRVLLEEMHSKHAASEDLRSQIGRKKQKLDAILNQSLKVQKTLSAVKDDLENLQAEYGQTDRDALLGRCEELKELLGQR